MSQTSTRAPSRTPSSTPVFPATQHTSNATVNGGHKTLAHHQHTTRAAYKLAHLFDSTNKYAVFQTTVWIHDMGNVPQMDGQFAVRWKFRGKRARGYEGVTQSHTTPTPKPSLPNLKLSQPGQSASSLSVNSFSSTASSPIAPMSRPAYSSTTPALGYGLPGRASTTPQTFTPVGVLPSSRAPSRIAEKKTSDPTPLRQSTKPGGNPINLTDSPKEIKSPNMTSPLDPINPRLRKASDETTASGRTVGSGSSTSTSGPSRPPSSSTSGSLLPPIHASSLPVSHLRPPSLMSVGSSQSHLSVPFPRTVNRPPVRSGTVPSTSTIVDPLPNSSEPLNSNIRNGISRTSSHNPPSPIIPSPTTSLRPDQTRQRSTSGVSVTSFRSIHAPLPRPNFSTERKGVTPPAQVSAVDHSCTWDFQLQHLLRLPVGKLPAKPPSKDSSSSASLRPPLLGFGPLSDSGMRIEVEQMLVSGATSSAPAQAADTDSVASVLAAAHHAQRLPGNPSEAGKRGEKESYGWVDIDLAMFAGRGRVTRRFLLQGRTNALVKLTVEMKFMGGEEKWTAPPLGEGQHVAGPNELLPSDPHDRHDLTLIHTCRSDSSDSSLFSGQKTPSHTSLSSSRDMNCDPMILPPLNQRSSGYKTYDHHLKPSSSFNSSPRLNSPHHHPQHQHQHQHHVHGHSRDLAPETVIESIFNPFPGKEEGPFSYLINKDMTEEKLVEEPGELEGKENGLVMMNGDVGLLDGGKERVGKMGQKEREEERNRRFGFRRRIRDRKDRETGNERAHVVIAT
ncbi:hypothetical protein TREMEDRAFT_61656 [Tremella mesenterica DSM 1558]|uniref:uncharacterized protein n=1 Tax=Tremella mesenterica (strain ATCC 24925 / CBS 8224 / DSM 1558 / NBRC 9311 / NRRL Y-6157 / RJB 2259-6 / UBC 559-6) TaxID=578456 RepID=UPI0003F49F98|nr:uncharacterized protein TREMEDRAFT_61656 [Tremella mesenterica DSM 1558]EIW69885.1 hypothetical protein TREMEDRAFT_61656 [Tremella mesenterica DSM 1558]